MCVGKEIRLSSRILTHLKMPRFQNANHFQCAFQISEICDSTKLAVRLITFIKENRINIFLWNDKTSSYREKDQEMIEKKDTRVHPMLAASLIALL